MHTVYLFQTLSILAFLIEIMLYLILNLISEIVSPKIGIDDSE